MMNKKRYITPKVEFEECEELMQEDNIGIHTSKDWSDTEGAKGGYTTFDDASFDDPFTMNDEQALSAFNDFEYRL